MINFTRDHETRIFITEGILVASKELPRCTGVRWKMTNKEKQ
jgi:hypothetical protein